MDFKSDLCDRNDLTMSRVRIEELNEIYKSLAEQIGLENTVVVYDMFRGTQVSFPNRMFSTDYVHKSIIEEYDGTNITQLAKKYNYTERTIWRIIKANENSD